VNFITYYHKKTVFLLKYSDRFWSPFCSEVLSTGLKQPGHQADRSHPSSPDTENEWSFTSAVTLTPQKRVLLEKKYCLIKSRNTSYCIEY
jgi:hypothetical protein